MWFSIKECNVQDSNLIMGKHHFAEYRPRLFHQDWTIYNKQRICLKTGNSVVFYIDLQQDADTLVKGLDAVAEAEIGAKSV